MAVKKNSEVAETRPQVADAPKAETIIKKKADGKPVGFCVYIGPSISGVIQSGTIYTGNRKAVIAALADKIEKYPQIANLVVGEDTLPTDRIKVKTPGNLLYVKYHELTGRK